MKKPKSKTKIAAPKSRAVKIRIHFERGGETFKMEFATWDDLSGYLIANGGQRATKITAVIS